MTATNKRLLISESHGDSNRCTPCRENLTNTPRMLPMPVHVRSMYASCGHSLYMATFHGSSIELGRPIAPEKNGLPTQSTARRWPIRGSIPIFSPEPANEVVGAKPSICQQPATRLIGPITPVCDRYVQYLLAGANRTVLNWHRRGLQPWRCQLATYHSLTFPTSSLPFPPKGPARSPV
jgi:hypothetical protein